MNIREIDIRLALWLLQPQSEYQWIGTQNIGHNLAEAIGEWRDTENPLPDENALIAAFINYTNEEHS